MFHAPRTKPGGRHKRMEIKHNTITSVLGSVTPPPRCLTLGSVGCHLIVVLGMMMNKCRTSAFINITLEMASANNFGAISVSKALATAFSESPYATWFYKLDSEVFPDI